MPDATNRGRTGRFLFLNVSAGLRWRIPAGLMLAHGEMGQHQESAIRPAGISDSRFDKWRQTGQGAARHAQNPAIIQKQIVASMSNRHRNRRWAGTTGLWRSVWTIERQHSEAGQPMFPHILPGDVRQRGFEMRVGRFPHDMAAAIVRRQRVRQGPEAPRAA